MAPGEESARILRAPNDFRFGHVLTPLRGESIVDVSPERVLEALGSGFVHLKGFRCTTVEELEAFTDRLPIRYFAHGMEGRSPRNADETIQDVGAEQYLDLALHFERSYLPGSPELCVFGLLGAEPHDGYTMLCDGVQLLDGLSADTRAFLRNNPVRYRKRLRPNFWHAVLRSEDRKTASERLRELARREPEGTALEFRFEDDGSLDVTFISPCIHAPAFDETKESFRTNIIRALWDIRDRLPDYFEGSLKLDTMSFENGEGVPEVLFFEIWNQALSCTTYHRWDEGDVVLIDNYRTMHGRYGRRAGDLVCRFGHRR